VTTGLPVLGGFLELAVLLVVLLWFLTRPSEHDDGR